MLLQLAADPLELGVVCSAACADAAAAVAVCGYARAAGVRCAASPPWCICVCHALRSVHAPLAAAVRSSRAASAIVQQLEAAAAARLVCGEARRENCSMQGWTRIT